MATARDVVSGAALRLRLVAPGEALEQHEANDILDALNGMMHSWEQGGLSYTHSRLSLSDEFPLVDGLHHGVKAMLAIKVSDVFGSSLTASLAQDARDGLVRVEAYFAPDMTVSFDPVYAEMNLRNAR